MHCSLTQQNSRDQAARRGGFSLTEVIIAVAILAMLAGVILRGVVQMRAMSEHTVYQSTAITVATGFIEQIKAMSYGELRSLATGATSTIPVVISNGQRTSVENGVESKLVVPLDADENGVTTLTMDLHILTRVTAIPGMPAVQVDLLYGFILPMTQEPRTSSITTTISDVPTH